LLKPATVWTNRQRAPVLPGKDALIPEAQRSGSLALTCVGQLDALKERRADGTALAGTLDQKQTLVDCVRFLLQLRQMLAATPDADVSGGR
jgi:hypothetical protein